MPQGAASNCIRNRPVDRKENILEQVAGESIILEFIGRRIKRDHG
jgi:hypothetical protein